LNRLVRFWFACCLASLLAACNAQDSGLPLKDRWATIQGSRLESDTAGEQFFFKFTVDSTVIEVRTPLTIKSSGSLLSGSLDFQLRSPEGQVAWSSGVLEPGDFSIDTEYSLPAGQVGTYQLGVVYTASTSAVYDLGWHALRLSPLVLLPGAGMLLVALAFVAYAYRRGFLGWRYLGLGALFWVLTVAAKFAFAIPVNPLVYRLLGVNYEDIFSPGNIIACFYIGALTGVFEAGLLYLILRRSRWGRLSWDQALVFGIGFGVIEALLIGLVSLTSALVGLLAPDLLSIPTLGSLANTASLVQALAPAVERLSVIFAHIFACVLIFYALATHESRWAWLAVGYKTLLDTPAAFASFWGVGTAARLWTIEAVVALFGLVGLWGIIQVARRYPNLPPSPEQP